MSIVGPTNFAWNVYESSNLVEWTLLYADLTLTTNVDATNGNTNFIDTTVAGVSNRFYQLSNSTSGCTSRVIGFVNLTIGTGTNLIADQLCQVDDGILNASAPNIFPLGTLNALFSPNWGTDQNETQIMKWNGTNFDVSEYFNNNIAIGWFDTTEQTNLGDATLLPGIGVLLSTTNAFTNIFVGLIREQQIFQIQTNGESQPTTNYLSHGTDGRSGHQYYRLCSAERRHNPVMEHQQSGLYNEHF